MLASPERQPSVRRKEKLTKRALRQNSDIVCVESSQSSSSSSSSPRHVHVNVRGVVEAKSRTTMSVVLLCLVVCMASGSDCDAVDVDVDVVATRLAANVASLLSKFAFACGDGEPSLSSLPPLVTQVDAFFDVDEDDSDNALLASALQSWWASLGDNATQDPFLVTRDLAIDAISPRADATVHATHVQAVMSSLLKTYHRLVWARCHWLQLYDGSSVSVASMNPKSRGAFGFVANPFGVAIDEQMRASFLLSLALDVDARNSESLLWATQQFNLILRRTVPRELTPCVFFLVGFDLHAMHHDFEAERLHVRRLRAGLTSGTFTEGKLRRGALWRDAFSSDAEAASLLKPIHAVMKHIVKRHELATECAAPTLALASSAFVDAMPFASDVGSTFRLPAPLQTSGASLLSSFRSFTGSVQLPFPPGACDVVYESVLAASRWRTLFNVRVCGVALVLKHGTDVDSMTTERDRTQHVAELFSHSLSAFRERVRLPLGVFGNANPILVSEVWSGRSLSHGWVRTREHRARVCDLLRRHVWPVIDALAGESVFYLDVHAGNVMVDESLENAHLIDFESAIQLSDFRRRHPDIADPREALRALTRHHQEKLFRDINCSV